ncbi:ABC transporter permease [Pseudomonas sp. SDO5271_S396]
MKRMPVVFTRQLVSYISAPSIYLTVAAFLGLSAALGVQMSQWMEHDNSDLDAFFQWHPWLYLLLIPVLSAQLWSDERNAGFFNVIHALPIASSELVVGKFLAAWTVCALTLALTFPIVIAVNYLGTADNAVIASQYLASWLLAGSYLSIGCFIYTFTHQRVIIFTVTLSLLFIASALYYVSDALEHQAPIWVIDSLIALSPVLHFEAIDSGKLTLHDGLYFISMILAFLVATTVALNAKRS